MTPREPDRFEAKAETLLFDMGLNVEMVEFEGDRDRLAAALRQAADEMRQASIDACDDAIGALQGDREVEAALECIKRIRALASPAAAPAAEKPILDALGRATPAPPHGSGTLDMLRAYGADRVAPSLLPRVLAEMEDAGLQAWSDSDKARMDRLRALAAELRRYIAEMEPRNVRDADSISLLQWKARARSAEAKWRSHMAALLTTIGGEVEGAPTAEHNFLQRLRELTTKELLLAKLQARTTARSGEGGGKT